MEAIGPSRGALEWLQLLLTVMFRGADSVKHKVIAAHWERDNCLGAEVKVRAFDQIENRYVWLSRIIRVPIGMVENHDVRRILDVFTAQSDGQIIMAEQSIQMIESEGLH